MYPFDYQRPANVAAATVAAGEGARYLAGGQSLIQAMRLRLSQSDALIDLGGLAELTTIRVVDGDQLVIGAMATHAAVASHADVRRLCPAIAELAAGIGDPMVRNMGTIGGSVANADPAACYPAGVLALGATIVTTGREIAADAFFTGLYETALRPGEMITAVRFAPVQRAAYVKFRQQASRFALVGVCVAQIGTQVRVAVTGARSHVFRATAIETALASDFSPAAARSVAMPVAGINADLHASADYRAAMIGVMAARAVEVAMRR